MTVLPKYLFAQNHDMPGAGMIIGTHHPFFYANIIKSKTRQEFNAVQKSHKGRACHPVGDYTISIVIAGTLASIPESFYETDTDLVKTTCSEMADFFFLDKMEKKQSYYNRYRLSA